MNSVMMKVPKPSTFSGLLSRSSSLSQGSFPPAAVRSLHSRLSSGFTYHDCAVFFTSVCHAAARPAASTSSVVRASSTTTGEERVPSIGFLGLGIMGTAMARNLVKAGYDVTVWNRTPSKCDALVHEGAKHGETPEQTAATCDITFAMLADPAGAVAPDVQMEVACGPEGAIKGLSPGKGYVDISTVDGDTSKEICSAVKETGAEFLEAPVSGSKKPAEDGTLIFLTAGDKALYERAAPFLDVMGKLVIAMLMVPFFVIYYHKSRFYLGDVGNGAAMKLVVNMVMGSMMASFSEGLLLGKKAGLDPTTIIEVIGQGAISAPMFAMKGPSMLKSSYPPAFPLKHQQKDLRLALAMAEDVAQPTPVAAAVNELYEHAKTTGLGDQDFSAVIEALRSDSKS